MSNKTYTAAEVEALIAAERAKSSKAQSNKSVTIRKATRVSKTTNAPYTGIFVEGPFRPFYIPMSVANALVQHSESFVAAVEGKAQDESKALASDTAPRLVAKS